jgi:hypothetical protein
MIGMPSPTLLSVQLFPVAGTLASVYPDLTLRHRPEAVIRAIPPTPVGPPFGGRTFSLRFMTARQIGSTGGRRNDGQLRGNTA